MPAGRCPSCGSSDYSPDQSPGGAGRNRCNACKIVAPVVTFYAVEPDRDLLRRVPDLRVSPPIHSHLKTTTPPAPIRQYKDDEE